MIDSKYSIGNDLSAVKEGDLVFHTERGCIVVGLVTDTHIFDEVGTKFDKHGKDVHSIGYPDRVFPVLFSAIVDVIGYFTYYFHYMQNDRNIDPRMK